MSALSMTAQGLINAYVQAFGQAASGLWYAEAVQVADTVNQEVLKVVALGQSKGLTPWPSGTMPTEQQLAQYALEMSVQDYHDGFPIPTPSLGGNPELWNAKAADTSRDTQYSVQSLVAAHFVANKVGLDGVALISASHVIGSQDAQTNSLGATEIPVSNVTTPAAPTIQEAIDIILAVWNYMKTYKGENGRLVNAGLRNLCIVVNTGAHFNAFTSAVKAVILAGGATNVLATMVAGGELNVKVFLDASLTGSNKVRFFNSTPGNRALVAGMEGPEDMSILDKGSEYARTYNGGRFAVKVRLGVASGWWANVTELTLT